MGKIGCQIKFLDTLYNTIDEWDYIEDISKFPMPRKGEYVNLINKDKKECIDYIVQEIKYAYKHDRLVFSSNTIVYIDIYVKRI